MKQRLVGATLLLVLAILIVPELLSGPKGPAAPPASTAEPVRNVTLDLATNATTQEGGSPAADAPAGRAAEEGVILPGVAPPAPEKAAPPDKPVQSAGPAAPVGPAPPPKVAPASPPASGWWVQLGSFVARPNAEKLAHRVRAHNAAVSVSAGVARRGRGGGKRGTPLQYRVRMGPFADRASAQRAIARLRGEGHPASLVRP